MMKTDVVVEARKLVGRDDRNRPIVKFKHQGRDPKTGIDCAGVIIYVLKVLGYIDFDYTAYERYPDGRTVRALMEEHLVQKPKAEAQPGDIVLLRQLDSRWPMHMGILTDGGQDGALGIIHSWSQRRGVIEQTLPPLWSFKTVACYELKGIEDGS